MTPRRSASVLASALLGSALIAVSLAGCAVFAPQADALHGQWPAALPARVELDDVPFFPQVADDCGPAALATLLAHDGLDASPARLEPLVYLPGRRGSLQAEMLAAPRGLGAVTWTLAPRLDDVLREVGAGHPVLVLQDWGAWPVHAWHYAVVVGYDRARDRVVLRSGDKRRLELPLAILEYTWKAGGRWAMVALVPDRVAATADDGAWAAAIAAFERVARPADATRAWSALLARWPDSRAGAIGAANAAYAAGDLASAERILRRAAERHADDAVVLNNLAQVLAERGRAAEALATAERAVAVGGPFEADARRTRDALAARLAPRPAAPAARQ